MGFCVANTKKGSGNRCVSPPIVSCRSCMASNKALCVFGGVRLISSAKITFPKSGPLMNRNAPLARRPVLLEDVGSGDIGRHQIGGELHAAKLKLHQRGQCRNQEGLRQAGHALQNAMSPAQKRDDQLFDNVVQADDHAADLLAEHQVFAMDLFNRGQLIAARP